MSTLRKTKNIMAKYKIIANKKFGQNFLIDDDILKKIVQVSQISKEELVIEIGPGLGNLTEYLLENAKYALLIEVDKKMLEILEDRFSNFNNYKIINQDVLKIDIDEQVDILEKSLSVKFKNVRVVANLPYYITTPIIFKLLQNSNRINDITVMVQKEVADRLIANPNTKDYGILTIMTKYYSIPYMKVVVPKESFLPAPSVTSAVVKLEKKKMYKVKDEKLFFDLVHASFAQRRKKIVNSLENVKFLNLEKSKLNDLISSCKININARAEEIPIEKFIEMSNKL